MIDTFDGRDRPGVLLPVIGQEPLPDERSDAARNRRLLLKTAATLVAESGACALTMDELARRAGVGKGTVFRRFGSRSGLMLALLDHAEQELQAGFMFGPPPLGPGADPVDRIVAFGRARLERTELQGDLQAESSGLLFSSRPYQTSLSHLRMLLREGGTPGDIALLADSLLAVIDARLVLHQLRTLRIPLKEIIANWETVARRVAAAASTNR